MITVAAMIVGLSGCVSRPDLSDRAEGIGDVLAAMPGVEKVETEYLVSDSGRTLRYRVTMTAEATDDEAAELASTLNNEVGHEFEDYNRELWMMMSGFTLSLPIETAVDALRQQVPRLRMLASSLPASEVLWAEFPDDDNIEDILEIKSLSGNPFDALSAVRDHFGMDAMSLRLEQTSKAKWYVKFPYSVPAQDGLEAALGSGLKEMDQIVVDSDQLTSFSVIVAGGPKVVGRLRSIIDLVNSSTSDPWSFSWSVEPSSTSKNKTRNNDLSTVGMVSVGGCDYDRYSSAEKDPSSYMTSEAIAVQNKLRGIYDKCL